MSLDVYTCLKLLLVCVSTRCFCLADDWLLGFAFWWNMLAFVWLSSCCCCCCWWWWWWWCRLRWWWWCCRCCCCPLLLFQEWCRLYGLETEQSKYSEWINDPRMSTFPCQYSILKWIVNWILKIFAGVSLLISILDLAFAAGVCKNNPSLKLDFFVRR